MPSVAQRRGCLTISLPRVINFNFLFQSLTRDISYCMENLPIDSLLTTLLLIGWKNLHCELGIERVKLIIARVIDKKENLRFCSVKFRNRGATSGRLFHPPFKCTVKLDFVMRLICLVKQNVFVFSGHHYTCWVCCMK